MSTPVDNVSFIPRQKRRRKAALSSEFYTTAEAGPKMRMHPKTVAAKAKRGEFPSDAIRRYGHRWLIAKWYVDAHGPQKQETGAACLSHGGTLTRPPLQRRTGK